MAVAEIVPTPPFRMLASKNDSLPTKTSKLVRAGLAVANASRNVFVLFQSPELSFIPAIALGYAARRRSTNPVVMPTTATGGMW